MNIVGPEGEVVARVDQRRSSNGEIVRWLAAMIVAAVVSYFTSIATLQTQLAVVQTRQEANFEEIQRALTDIKLRVDRLGDRMDRAADDARARRP